MLVHTHASWPTAWLWVVNQDRQDFDIPMHFFQEFWSNVEISSIKLSSWAYGCK
jgi:hypothetical protein